MKDKKVLYIATDLHYLAPNLLGDGNLFNEVYAQRDGKITGLADKVIEIFIDHVLTKKPDIIILPGDLTFNGELESLKSLVEKLKPITEAGIPILTIPGNHDIDYPHAYDFSNNKISHTENITHRDFQKLLLPLAEIATSKDTYSTDIKANTYNNNIKSLCKWSMSYSYTISQDLQVIMLDANTELAPNTIGEETFLWLENQLKEARDAGITTITVTHQNLLQQNTLAATGYVLNDNAKLENILRKYHVSLNLSGHIHFSHEKIKENLSDIVTGSLTVAPLHYLIVEASKVSGDFDIEEQNLAAKWQFNYHYESIKELYAESLESLRKSPLGPHFLTLDVFSSEENLC